MIDFVNYIVDVIVLYVIIEIYHIKYMHTKIYHDLIIT